ncbi:AAA domain-containing protein [Chloroflexota bacterium]
MTNENQYPECIDRWRRQLLDLTGRNRMLYYRKSRATLDIYEKEDAIWKQLQDEGEVLLHEGLFTPDSIEEDQKESRIEEANRRIKRLNDLARTFLDEQGIHVIYAVFGWLNWIDESRPPLPGEDSIQLRGGKSVRKVKSPLLFVPITFDISSKTCRVKLEENATIETNLALETFLNQQLGIRIDINQEVDPEPNMVLNEYRRATEHLEHWSVEKGESVLIDSFSFRKIALLRQIEKSIDLILNQPVLQAFCGDAQQLLEAPAVPSYEDLDSLTLSEELNTVVPADASQTKALLAVKNGANVVIQGPPGTGKSQTITNIISTMIAQAKTVLFIAEKRPAREIVVDNLIKAGLGDIVLHITEEVLGQRGSSQAKRDIVDQLADILDQGAGQYTVDKDYRSEHELLRKKLSHYSKALFSKISVSNTSTPFQLMADWTIKDQNLAKTIESKLPSIENISDFWQERALEYASKIDDLGEDILVAARQPWLNMQTTEWDAVVKEDLINTLNAIVEASQAVNDLVETHWTLNGLPYELTLDYTDELTAYLNQVGVHYIAKKKTLHLLMPSYWKSRTVSKEFHQSGQREDLTSLTAEKLRERVAIIRQASKRLEQFFPECKNMALLRELAQFAQYLLDTVDTADSNVVVRKRCLEAAELGLNEVFIELVKMRLPGEKIRDIFDVTISKYRAEEAYQSDPCFHDEGTAINRQIKRLGEYEKQVINAAKLNVLNAVAPHRPGLTNVAPRDSELGILRSQINAKRRKPLRWLFTKSANTILQMKPCIVASPLAVAQFLHSDNYVFDIVIFDEASQIPTADAVIPISRAKQVVIVGDSQQMPPTSFFDRAASQESESTDEILFESVLQDSEALLPSLPLRWHYRSQDERLIAFSNYSFYDGKLLTFPSAWLEHPELGIKYVYLPDAVYGRGGSRANPEEAQKVIEILEEELTEHPEHNIGIVAMSIAHAVEIQSRLEQRAIVSVVIREWMERGGRARHLETVQGDEFDVSILSFGYGRDAAGNLHLNFGPLSRDDGYKRLNVCVTRARKKMIVVSSIRGADIPLGRVSEGGQRVRQFLEYAENGPAILQGIPEYASSNISMYESPFEEHVAQEIRSLGWTVDTQIGVHRFRVDIGIKHPLNPGIYLAGVECDGATYHSGETVRDRDIGRQQVLEKLGWNIYRIWSPDWFRDRLKVLRDLHEYLSSLLDNGGGENGDGNNDDGNGGDDSNPSQDSHNSNVEISEPSFTRFDAGLKAGTIPYRTEGPSPPPSDVGDLSGWLKWLVGKIEVEGPFHELELTRFLRAHNADSRSSLLLRNATEKKQLKTKNSVYWHSKTDLRFVPVKVSIGSIHRNIEFYTDEEILRALELSCADAGSLSESEIVKHTAHFLGFSRVLRPIRDRIESLIQRAVRDSYIIQNNGCSYRAGEYWNCKTTLPTRAPYLLKEPQLLPYGGRPSLSKTRATVSEKTATTRVSSQLPIRRTIANAFTGKSVLKIQYRNASGYVTERKVDILALGNNYIDAYDHLRNEPRTFKIDRILRVSITTENYSISRRHSPSQWVSR